MRVPLIPPPGLVSDDTTFAAEGAWETCSNMRFWRGKPQTIGYWDRAISDALTGVCRNILAWTTVGAGVNVAFGTHSALQVYVSGTLYDITPSGLSEGSIDAAGSAPGWGSGAWNEGTWSTPNSTYYPRTWALSAWGENLVASPRGGTLYLWENDGETEATVVTNAPDEITWSLVTSERQVLALGCNEEVSGDFNPLCIRGCDIEDLTNWTTAANNNAFEHILEGGGRIVAGRLIGPYVAVWTDNSLYVGQFLGNPGQTYRFDRVDDNCGLIGQNAVHVYKGVAYWISPDRQFRAWSPGGKPAIVPCPVRNDFADNLDISQSAKIVASGVSQFDEIWWFYPDSRDGSENSRYVALGLSEGGGWFRGEMARTAACDSGVSNSPMAVDPDGIVYNHELGMGADWSISSADQYIGNAETVLQIQGIWPDFENQEGDVTLSVRVRKYPQADAVTKGPFTLSEGVGKKDFRATGRVAAVDFSGTGFVRFGKPTFEAVETGRR